jgi:hypothetical protein
MRGEVGRKCALSRFSFQPRTAAMTLRVELTADLIAAGVRHSALEVLGVV